MSVLVGRTAFAVFSPSRMSSSTLPTVFVVPVLVGLYIFPATAIPEDAKTSSREVSGLNEGGVVRKILTRYVSLPR